MIIWTNGCFDVLHKGHVELFKYAKSLGNKLIVGIDSDNKVKRDKGETRPINTEMDRKLVLEAIKYIDQVVVFDTIYGLEMAIKKCFPDIMVIGSDWEGKPIIGSEHAKKVVFFDRIPGYSTTEILNGK